MQVIGKKIASNPSVAGAPANINAALHVLAVRSLNIGLAQVLRCFL